MPFIQIWGDEFYLPDSEKDIEFFKGILLKKRTEAFEKILNNTDKK